MFNLLNPVESSVNATKLMALTIKMTVASISVSKTWTFTLPLFPNSHKTSQPNYFQESIHTEFDLECTLRHRQYLNGIRTLQT